MDMFQCIPDRCNEPSLHGYCSKYSSISSSDTNSVSINNEEELMMSVWAMCNYDSSASLGFFLPQEQEEEEEDRLVTATQSDTNPLSSTSKEEQDEDNEVLEEAEDRREKDEQEVEEERKEEYKREKEGVEEEEEERREKEEEGRRRKRKRVKISKDPQSVAARNRRHRISQKIRVLRKLVPGGMKMDTASMLDEAVQYLKCLKAQVRSMEALMNALENAEPFPFPFSMPMPMEYYY